MNAKLIMTIGLPHSGKSTWAKQQGFPIVNPDAIRLAIHGQTFLPQAERLVWALAHYMVDALFLAGNETVILDATNVTDRRRVEWMTHKYPFTTEIERQIFETIPSECIARAEKDNRPDLIPVIERMMKDWDLPIPHAWCEMQPDGSCGTKYRCMHTQET
jgi:predicted kinase